MKEKFSTTEAIVAMICLSLAMFALDADNLKTATVFGTIGMVAMISVMLDITAKSVTDNSKNDKA
jgi:hypothetical protein